jgi:glycosyltransferase involved in cell wall biosynthesis
MKVSAIIPTYNRRKYICRAIDSVLSQSIPVDELIVVDDGSSDGTAEMIEEKYGPQVRLIRQTNTGVAGARHHGIREARGEWIAFLDSDDSWMPDRNRQLLEAASKVPADVAWIFGDLRVVTDSGEGFTLFEEHGLVVQGSPEIFPDSLTVQYPFQFGLLQASFIRRSALLELNCFSEGLRSDDDLLAGFQVACHHRVAAIPDVVGRYYRTSDLSASSVVVNGVYGRDHYRSRMLAFAQVIESGHPRKPWDQHYASEVQGLCKVLATKGTLPRNLALQQFRYGGYSTKGLAFALAALFGRSGVLAWLAVAKFCRAYLVPHPAPIARSGESSAQLQSPAHDKTPVL